jgi:uncharacterized repeat protein (TIGR02543 family)
MIKGLITSKNFVFIALLTLAALALTSGAGPLAPSTTYAESIWSDAATPGGTDDNGGQPIELGLKFRASANGCITGLRFYRVALDTGTHVGSLWKTDGTLYETLTFTTGDTAGWQQMLFASPVPITANTTYVASNYSPLGHYAYTSAGLASGVVNGNLQALQDGVDGPNGVFKLGGGFPDSSYNSTNYWVDVVFTTSCPSDTTPPTVSSVSPANGATNVNTTVNITATFSEAIDPATINATTFVLRDSLSNLVPASVTYNAATKIAVLNPTSSLSILTSYTATVNGGASGVKDLRGNAMSANYTWSFTTAWQTVYTIWNEAAVPTGIYDNGEPIEVGVKLRADVAGYITGLRFYKAVGDTWTSHVGNLWLPGTTPTNLATVTFTGETSSGWQQMAFSSPVLITANTTYVASYYSQLNYYAADATYFATKGADNAPLHALQDGVDGPNGVYKTGVGSGFPDQSFNSTNYWVDVTFIRIPRTLTVTSSPVAGGSVTLSPPGGNYDDGTSVQLTAVPATGYRFDHWTGDLTGSANPASISMTANRSVTAVFIQTFTLTVTSSPAAGGSVTLSPPGGTYDTGTVVQLTASANAGYTFNNWTGGATGTSNPVNVTMNGNKSVTANFTQNQYTLTVVLSPVAGGSVTKNPNKATYVYGDVVQLTASANGGYTFSSWTGDATGTSNPVSVTITGNKSVTANFAINTFTLTYNAGANGSISGTTPQTVNYGASGTAVTAVPATGYHFVQWSDGSTVNPRTDTNVTANITVTASFAINTYTLTYTAGAHGTISGTSPQTVNYGASGTAVTAVPATGYHFVQWSDGSTTNPRTDTNVTANITVSASFAINTYTLTYTAGANGTISGATPQTVNYGASGTAVSEDPAPG